jgi:hypothetical protein
MPSTLHWLDHDPAQRDRMARVLALFRERETRDELGLGGIRDAISNLLFPGVSTVQTRLKYFLLVAWVYRRLEDERTPSNQVAGKARKLELALVNVLKNRPDAVGVFGKEAGQGLKNLPSAIYWTGLGEWRIRLTPLTARRYHQALDDIYRRRRTLARTDEGEVIADLATQTWHPHLPPIPDGFPDSVDLALTRDEARFLQERIVQSRPDALLARLASWGGGPWTDVPFAWEHPDLGRFSDEHRRILHHAEIFSHVAQGTALLYNLRLAEIDDREALAASLREQLENWPGSLDPAVLAEWRLEALWATVLGQGHTITMRTRRFLADWFARVRVTGSRIADDADARRLIEVREMQLKGPRSRFRNKRAREQWSGQAGTARMRFRWPQVAVQMLDLHRGLNHRS